MKRPYLFDGAVVLAAILVVAPIIGFGVYRTLALKAESTPFIETSVRAIAAHWDQHQLLDRATPELRANAAPQELASAFGSLAELGAPLDYQPGTGDFHLDLDTRNLVKVWTVATVRVRCEHGTVALKLTVVRRDERWMINDFDYDIEPAPAKAK